MNWLEKAKASHAFATLDFTPLLKLEEHSSNGESFVCEVLDIYLRVSPEQIKDMCEVIKTRDFQKAQRAAHNLRSSSANLGARKLASICAKIENLTKFESMNALIVELQLLFPATFTEISRLRELHPSEKKTAS